MTASVWVLGDQLLNDHPAIIQAEREFSRQDLVVLLVESQAQAWRLPYHAKKLVLLYSAMRHYAEKLCQAGYRVDYRKADNLESALMAHLDEFKSSVIFMMKSSSMRGKIFQDDLTRRLNVKTIQVDNTQFMCGQYDPLPEVAIDQSVRQEQFYRKMREHFHLLIDEAGHPTGGKWNYDQKNRQPLPPSVSIPPIPQFSPDLITQDVIAEVNQQSALTGSTAGFDLAVTNEEAQQTLLDFLDQRLPNFGTYEDGMRQNEPVLFHSKLALYLNIGLLDPLELARQAEKRLFEGLTAINNVEGFIRQVIGWREYMYWQYQRLMPDLAQANYWGFNHPLPNFFWNTEATSMNCLRHVIDRVMASGYTHHIERLMVLTNFCLLSHIHPQEVYDWFSAAFVDAYEWVMVPNVYGMGLYADGGKIASKPYIASANYINRMSDYCKNCAYDKNKRTGEGACPYNFLYWNFLLEQGEKLAQNYRMKRMLHNLRFLEGDERTVVKDQASKFLENLS